MSSDPPSDLIKQSKITFRKDARIPSSYNRQQTTLKANNNIPNIQTSLSALDNSTSSLSYESISCKHCNYKLLRGSHSLICICCGQCQANESRRPESIVFKSTIGYRWLLQSLELNDSERIDTFFEENRRNKGGTPVEEGIPLAELFDVQITWRDEHDNKPETGHVNKTSDRFNSLSFDQFGWENFVTSSQIDSGSDVSEEQSVGSKNDQSDEFRDDETFSPFQNDSPRETDAKSRASSEHDSEGQYVSSGAQDEDSKAAVSRDSSSGDDAELHRGDFKTRDEDSNAYFDFRGDSSPGHDVENQFIESGTQTDDLEATVSRDYLVGDNAEIDFVDPKILNDDSETILSRKSSSGDDTEIHSLSIRMQNEDPNVSSGLTRDSSPERDTGIQIIKSGTQKHDSTDDLNRDSLSSDLLTQIEDSRTATVSSDLRGDSSSGSDAETQSVSIGKPNDHSNTTATILPLLRKDSSSEDEAKVKSVNVMTDSEDSESTAAIIPDLRSNSSSEDEAKVKSLNVTTHNEDSESSAAIFPDSPRHSSSEDEAKIHSVNAMTQNNDSKTNLRPDSFSEDEAKVKSVDVMTHNEGSKIPGILIDSRGGSSSGSDTEKYSFNSRKRKEDSSSGDEAKHHSENVMPHNKDSKTPDAFSNSRGGSSYGSDAEIQTASSSDLRQESPSGDEDRIQSLNFVIQNEGSKTPTAPSDYRGDSSSDDDIIIQPTNSSTQNKESEAKAELSSGLRRDSSSGDDAGIQSVSRTHSVDSKSSVRMRGDSSSGDDAEILHTTSPADLRRVSSSGDDTKIQFLNTETQNDDSKTNTEPSDLRDDSLSWGGKETHMNSRKWNESSTSDLRGDSLSPDDEKIQYLNVRTNHGDSQTDLSRNSSFGDDPEIPAVNSVTRNVDFTTASVSSDLRGDGSPRHDEEIRYVDSMTQNELAESMPGGDMESQLVNIKTQNDDIKDADVSSDLRGDGSPRHNEEIQFVNSETTDDVSLDPRRDSMSGDDTDNQFVNIKTPKDDSKTSDYSSRNAAEIKPMSFRTRNDDSEAAMSRDLSSRDDAQIQLSNPEFPNEDIEVTHSKTTDLSGGSSFRDAGDIQPVKSGTKNEDSETALVSPHLSSESSFADDMKVQNEDIQSAVVSSGLRSESPPGDDTETQPVKSSMQNENFKSAESFEVSEVSLSDHGDPDPRFMEDLNSESLGNNLDPVQDDDQIEDNPTHKD